MLVLFEFKQSQKFEFWRDIIHRAITAVLHAGSALLIYTDRACPIARNMSEGSRVHNSRHLSDLTLDWTLSGKDHIIFTTPDDEADFTEEKDSLPVGADVGEAVGPGGEIDWDCPCLQGTFSHHHTSFSSHRW
jgi:hypothetical protein